MKVLVLYYSMTGNVYRMAKLVADGVREAGAEAVIKTVPELVPAEAIAGNELVQKAKKEQADVPIATPSELPDYDAIIIGTPTRFGDMCAQLRNFWDQTGSLWGSGALVGKPAGVFCCSNTLHGGQETTIITTMLTCLHHGMVIVGVPYTVPEISTPQAGGSPYGPSHVAGRPPTNPITPDVEVVCRALGARVAEVATKLAA
ncbi:MAG: NAD(P)H:quinone oxidoreductase [Armatimonadota bacterium]|nr:NAD(P)H:quinone oxidoreductase [Armatimonadota bacterium]